MSFSGHTFFSVAFHRFSPVQGPKAIFESLFGLTFLFLLGLFLV